MVLTPQDARQLLDSITRIEKSIRSIQTSMALALRETGHGFEEIERQLGKVGHTGTEAVKSIGKASEETVELMTSAWTDFGSRASAAIDQVKRKMDEIEHHPALRSVFGTKDNPGTGALARIPQLVGGMQSASAGLEGGGVWGFLAQIAMGGGGMNIQENVLGQRLSATFNATARSATTDIQGLGRALLEAQNEFGKSNQIVEGYATTLKALADAGVTEEKALERMRGVTGGFGETVSQALTGLDKLFALPTGQSAALATQMVQDMGINLQEATENLKNMGYAARGSGASVEMFIGTLSQASSSMRMQVTQGTDLVKTYGLMHDAISKLTPGMGPEALAKTSLNAFAGLAQGAAGFNDVQKAYLGRLMQLPGGGLQRITEFELGASAPGKRGSEFMTDLANTLVNLTRQHARGRFDEERMGQAEFFLKHSPATAGLPLDTIRAIATAAVKGTGASSDLNSPSMQAAVDAMKKVISAQADPMEKLIENLQKLMASLGQMLLTLIMSMANMLATMGSAIVEVIRHPTTGGDAMEILKAGFAQEKGFVTASAARVLGDAATFGKTGADLITQSLGLHTPIISKEDADKYRITNTRPEAAPAKPTSSQQRVIDQLAGEPITIDATNMHQTITTTVPITIKLALPSSNAEPPAH